MSTWSLTCLQFFPHSPHYYQKSVFPFFTHCQFSPPCMTESSSPALYGKYGKAMKICKATSLRRWCLSYGQMRRCHPCKDFREELSRQKKQMQSPQIRSDHRERRRRRKQTSGLEGREVGPWRPLKGILIIATMSSVVISYQTTGLLKTLNIREFSLVNCLKHRS